MFKQSTEYKSIQKKLVAAVAMVLVACIMVVSSSYAWFTLSTAPEVTGITTAVGSNGNLEMALRTVADVAKIGDAVGQVFPEANKYWGNLVDLSSTSEYGLDKITLAPARLNAVEDTANSVSKDVTYTAQANVVTGDNPVTADEAKAALDKYVVYSSDLTTEDLKNAVYQGYPIKSLGTTTAVYAEDGTTVAGYTRTIVVTATETAYKLNSTGFLQTPEYGTDGRVSQITANTVNGPYNKENGTFAAADNTYGVRAVGVTSNISPEALALRNAKQAVNSAISTAKNGASTSLKEDSVKLANILINNKLTGQTTFAAEDYDNVEKAITNLENVAALLEDALKQAVVAVAVSQFPGKTFTTAGVTFGTDITVKDSTGAEVTIDWDGVTDNEGNVTYPDLTTFKAELIAAYGKLTTGIKADLAAAKAQLGTVADKTKPTYSELSNIMTKLLSTGNFTVSKDGTTYTIDELMNLGTGKAGLIMAGNPTINIISGIYHDIALFTDNYSAATSLNVTAPDYGFDNEELKVTMQTQADEPTTPMTGYYLPVVLTQMSALPTPGGTASSLITDTYGYVLDFAFRTNAVGSNLLLQTAGVSRVGDDTTVQGAGSYMKFKTIQTDYTQAQMLTLMEAIRVVFVNDNNEIYGVATLDVGYTDLVLTEVVESATQLKAGDTITYTVNGKTVTSTIKAIGTEAAVTETGDDGTTTTTGYKYTGMTVNDPNYTVDADGYITAYLYMMDYSIDSNGKMTIIGDASTSAITALQQNTATAVSALVYLDGDYVDNGDVAISGDSMTGTMNLQFASSAELDPMDYTFDTKTPLATPTLSITDNTLTIGTVENAASYNVKVSLNSLSKTINVTGTSIDLTSYLDQLSEFAAGQTATITVTAVPAEGSEKYTESAASDSVTWTVPTTG